MIQEFAAIGGVGPMGRPNQVMNMKPLKSVGLAIAMLLVPQLAWSAPAAKHVRKPHHRSQPVAPRAAEPFDMSKGNAALGGNSANSAFGSNSANENANGRTGGGFGG
jgi:hypothetical protein